jgi:hypothetical protein
MCPSSELLVFLTIQSRIGSGRNSLKMPKAFSKVMPGGSITSEGKSGTSIRIKASPVFSKGFRFGRKVPVLVRSGYTLAISNYITSLLIKYQFKLFIYIQNAVFILVLQPLRVVA